MLAEAMRRPEEGGDWRRPELADQARHLAEAIPDGLLLTDRRGRIIFVNARLLAMTGHAEEDLLGRPVEVLVPEHQRRSHVQHRRTYAEQPAHRPSGTTLDLSVQRADGTTFPADIALNPVHWAGEDVVVAVISDLSPRKRAEHLRTLQFAVTRILSEAGSLEAAAPRLLRTLSEALAVEVGEFWMVDPSDGSWTMRSSWHSPRLKGADRDRFEALWLELMRGSGGNLNGNLHPVAGTSARPAIELQPSMPEVAGSGAPHTIVSFPVFTGGEVVAIFDLLGTTGRVAPPEVHDVMLDIGEQIGHFVQRRRAESALVDSMARLAEVAATDPLTGIRNRREFDRMLSTIPRKRFAVLAADVDNLKQLNDEYGHEAGDAALRAVASTMVAALRGWDMVARTGGDEFAMLVSDVSAREAAAAAERVREAVGAVPLAYGQVRISVGWATGPAGVDPHAVLGLADAHLNEAKRLGRNRAVGAPMGRRGGLAARRSEWSARIDRALTQNEIGILYQPIVRLEDGVVIGHEALARPEGMGPSDSVESFFSEAYRTGRIRDLDWLCRRSAMASVPWPMPREWTLFVNVSAAPLLDPVHDVDQLLLMLEAVNGRPDQVVLEITERERISDLVRVREVLAAYRSHGFRFALDDVGEGHSTLELLVAASPEYIKLARSLTLTAAHSSSRAAIRGAVAFAQTSGATVLAEGVENQLAAWQMAELGVTLGQGWWLGRPGSLDAGSAGRSVAHVTGHLLRATTTTTTTGTTTGTTATT